MSDEVKVNDSEFIVDDFYGEPLDLIKYINTNNADEFMSFLIDEAIDFYVNNEFSPIIEQQKVDGFVIDYYFLADCLSKFIENKIMQVADDEKVAKNARLKFKDDFTESGESFIKNAALLLGVFDYLNIVIFQKKSNTVFARTVYSTENEIGEILPFVMASVFLHKDRIPLFEKNLKRIGNKNNYKVEAFGKSIGSVLLKFGRSNAPVFQF